MTEGDGLYIVPLHFLFCGIQENTQDLTGIFSRIQNNCVSYILQTKQSRIGI